MRITALSFLALIASTEASQAAVCAPGTYVSTPPPADLSAQRFFPRQVRGENVLPMCAESLFGNEVPLTHAQHLHPAPALHPDTLYNLIITVAHKGERGLCQGHVQADDCNLLLRLPPFLLLPWWG